MGKTRTVVPRGEEYVEFGKNLAACRNALGLSQAEIARQLGIIQSTYAGWETGTRKVQLSTIIQLANFFHVDVDVLIGTKSLIVPASHDNFILKESEKAFVLKCRMLNSTGKAKLLERADELLDLGYIEKGDEEKMA